MSGLLVVTPAGPDADALCSNLKDRGFTVFSAANGAEAIGVAIRRQPDVILMDPALSAMDRWHAVKRLNTEVGTARIPVLTLASDASSPAGLQRVLSKIERTLGRLPAEAKHQRAASSPPKPAPPRSAPPGSNPPRQVDSIMVDAIMEPPPRKASAKTDPPRSVRTPASAPASVAVAPPLQGATTPPMPARRTSVEPPGRLLVVDDNALNRDMLSRRLRRRNYEVLVAEDGEEALRIIEESTIDLVLLDWMMPGLSGIDVLHRIRATHSQVQLPVIMATAKTEAEDIVEALRAEANDYVTKPLNFDVVHARIRTQLNLVKAHREVIVSERRFRALLENTGDMIVQYEPSGRVHYVSPASRTLLGWEPDALKARTFYDWIHPLDRRELETQQKASPTLPPGFTFIARMQRQDATYIWVETSCRVLVEAGSPLIQAACRDVTEHMDSLTGDEPPLPLGGDIMAHPGWRGMSGKPAPERDVRPPEHLEAMRTNVQLPSTPAKATSSNVPVLLLTTLDGLDIQAFLGAPEGQAAELSDHVKKKLLQLLAGSSDG